jgi:stage II sporulation protein P
MFIDIHRDAYDNSALRRDAVIVDGKLCAKIMFVVGTGEATAAQGELPRPNWQQNFQLAQSVTNQLNKYAEGLAKPVRVKSNRYNQHVSDMCMLIEIGHNGNTLQEAKNSVPYVAKAIAAVVKP